MAKIEAKIEFNIVPLLEDTDLSECISCRDIIYGNMYRIHVMPNNGKLRLLGTATELCLCESCKDLINE